MRDVRTGSLEVYCQIDSGFAFKSERFSEHPDDICLVKGSNLGHKEIDWVNGPKWSAKEFDSFKRYELVPGDIVIAMDRPIVGGNLKFAWIQKNDPKSLLVQRVARLRSRYGLDQGYLRCVIADPAFKAYIDTITTGVNVPHISGPDMKRYRFPIPPLSIQQKIAHILSAHDDLIENNMKRIKLLEEMAQITYEQWIVRMKFPGHETTPIDAETGLPEGWLYRPVGSLLEHEIGGGWGKGELSQEYSEPAYVIRGTDFKSISKGDFSDVPFRFHKKSNLASRKLKHGDIIFEVSGGSHYAGVARSIFVDDELLHQLNKEVMCASFCKLARTDSPQNSYMLYHFFQYLRSIKATEVFEIRSASNIVNYNWTAFLKFQQIPVPSEIVLHKFQQCIAPIHKQLYQLGKQNQLIKEARDILLPRLMTGMIDVNSMELLITEVGTEVA